MINGNEDNYFIKITHTMDMLSLCEVKDDQILKKKEE